MSAAATTVSREQDAFRRLEAVRELLHASCVSFYNQDLEARLVIQVCVGRRPDRPEEVVLSMQDAMGDHADVVPIDERDCANHLPARFPALAHEGPPDEFAQRLGAARESLGTDEPVEVLQQTALKRNTDSVDRHVLPSLPSRATGVFKPAANP